MSDEVLLDGVTYISSKRASELSGYAQDYIGQLARGGKIDARRVAGLWYIHKDALLEHQNRTDTHVSPERSDILSRSADSITATDGTEYVSANRASKLSGYNQDYIGQLARAQLIPAQQFGNRWYVQLEPLLSHKRHKDSLLAAVQTESVGLQRQAPDLEEPTLEETSPTHFHYVADVSPLVPAIEEVDTDHGHDHRTLPEADSQMNADEPHTRIPIRIHRTTAVPGHRIVRSDMISNYLVMSRAMSAAVACIVLIAGAYLVIASGIPGSVTHYISADPSDTSAVGVGQSEDTGTGNEENGDALRQTASAARLSPLELLAGLLTSRQSYVRSANE